MYFTFLKKLPRISLFGFYCSAQMYSSGRSTVSTVGTICANKAVGISVDINPFEPHLLAANLAHSIGHNLGLTHDTPDGGGGLGGLGMGGGASLGGLGRGGGVSGLGIPGDINR